MSLIVKSKVQEFAKKHGLMVASDFYDALDKEVQNLIRAAAKRTTANKRKTLKPYDL